MNRYTFLRVKVAYTNSVVDPSAYETAIHERAAEGWDFVQIFVENPAAVAIEHVIVFKRTAAS
jgi:Domain of unknown function (DUF4177)